MAAPAPRPAAAARGTREVSSPAGLAALLRQPPTHPCAREAQAPGSLRGRRRGRPVSGLCGACQPRLRGPRGRPSRGGGRVVTSRGARRWRCGPVSRTPIGRQVDVGVAVVQRGAGSGPGCWLLWTGQDNKWMACKPVEAAWSFSEAGNACVTTPYAPGLFFKIKINR